MSYGLTCKGVRANVNEYMGEAITSWVDEVSSHPDFGDVETEIKDQLNDAISAAVIMAKSVGQPEDHIAITINGHANPAHRPKEGYANESLQITIQWFDPTDEAYQDTTPPISGM